MTILIKNINNLVDNSKYLPIAALQDIDKRMGDWLASGGSLKDGYIKQQFRYAENIIRIVRAKHD